LFAIRWKCRFGWPAVCGAVGSSGAFACEWGSWQVEQLRFPPAAVTYLRRRGSAGVAAPAAAFVTLADQLWEEPVPATRFAWSAAVHAGER
jgi:hypothetical protein